MTLAQWAAGLVVFSIRWLVGECAAGHWSSSWRICTPWVYSIGPPSVSAA